MTNALDAMIFDVDGTLVDSVDLHTRCWRRALARYGKEVSFESVRRQIGKGGDQFLPEFLTATEIAAFGTELEEYRGRLWKWYLMRVRPFPAVRLLFKRMRREGLKLAVASSAKEDELDEYLRIAEIEDLVDVRVSSDDAERSKPAPDIFAAALEKLHVEPSRALVAGDTPWDALAAKRAGLETIGLVCGGWTADNLRRAGCFAVYIDPLDLLTRFDDSPMKMLRMYREGTPLSEIAP